jgi:GDSL-like Lipase/Acylhydrolase family
MSDQFSEMDKLTSEEVALFKEQAKNKERENLRALSLRDEASSATLVAEGDSWFDYLPGTDIIDCLRNNHDLVVDNYASAGDTLENMIYGTGINKRFERVSPSIEIVLRCIGELKPKAFLFSGGGNDVAGEEFESYLNHKDSGLPVLRMEFIDNMINNVFRRYFEDLVKKVKGSSPETHIVVHGYGHTAPTGEGVDLFIFRFAGPWLRPALARKGIFNAAEQRSAVFTMIDKFNDMLKGFAQTHRNVHFVDLRSLIDPDRDWANELHLKNNAFARVAQQIFQVIQAI